MKNLVNRRLQALGYCLTSRPLSVFYYLEGLCSLPDCKGKAAFLCVPSVFTGIEQIYFLCLDCAKDADSLVTSGQIMSQPFPVEKKVIPQSTR